MVSRDVQKLVRGITRKFDFGEYEMAAYMTVLENGELTASEIGTRTDIPQTRVYDTVRDLESRGVVDIEETRPMRVIAVGPERAFDSVESTVAEVVDELRSRYSEPVWDGEAATLVRSRTSVLRYLDEIAELAEFELSLSLTPGLMSRVEMGPACPVASPVLPSAGPSPAARGRLRTGGNRLYLGECNRKPCR